MELIFPACPWIGAFYTPLEAVESVMNQISQGPDTNNGMLPARFLRYLPNA